jgi:hypothetical protein
MHTPWRPAMSAPGRSPPPPGPSVDQGRRGSEARPASPPPRPSRAAAAAAGPATATTGRPSHPHAGRRRRRRRLVPTAPWTPHHTRQPPTREWPRLGTGPRGEIACSPARCPPRLPSPRCSAATASASAASRIWRGENCWRLSRFSRPRASNRAARAASSAAPAETRALHSHRHHACCARISPRAHISTAATLEAGRTPQGVLRATCAAPLDAPPAPAWRRRQQRLRRRRRCGRPRRGDGGNAPPAGVRAQRRRAQRARRRRRRRRGKHLSSARGHTVTTTHTRC